MAIFGRSKKAKQSTSKKDENLAYGPLPIPEGSYLYSQSNSTFNERRPNTSRGYGAGSGQGWESEHYGRPIHITNNFLITPPPLPERPQKSGNTISKLNLKSVSNLLSYEAPEYIPGARYWNDGVPAGTQYLNQGAALCDLISSKLDAVITQIDGERFSGDERELAVFQPPQPIWQQEQPETMERGLVKSGKSKGMVNNSVSSALSSTNYFAKVHLYANSRLPPYLPPMKLYMETYPLLCLAAQYSERVYSRPVGQERETHVEADWRMGTKAMVIKSVPMDAMNTIVFAIRGTQTFMDWAVNLNSAPAEPLGFLDDPGNLCHAGFLTVARKMVRPVAARLRNLLEEHPGRCKYSLIITGHSAGGAIASLLYCHMLSNSREAASELNDLKGSFKRIHCISFGAPPVSLLPLTKPPNDSTRKSKSLFMSFVNEGDPVARADRAYVRSLLDLYSSPPPNKTCMESLAPPKLKPILKNSSSTLTLSKKKPKVFPAPGQAPVWPVPEATLSNAGRLVLLRSVERYETSSNKKKQLHDRMNEGIVAQVITDELLRGVVWGDPMCHMMKLYERRIQVLATNAVLGRS
ncbi:Alpha/Beta hydrolase protein [Halenospora varia]|nr:Alpha/Beta hydrolase protein [Halenospora varia]